MSQEKTNLFEIAVCDKYRFDTVRGSLSIEQLQDAPLRSSDGYSLNDVAKDLNSKIKAAGDEDFVSKKTEVDRELQNKFELVKLLIATRIQEEENELNLASKSAEKKRLLGFLAQKQDEALGNLSAEEIQAKIDAL